MSGDTGALNLSIDGVDAKFYVVEARVEEKLHGPFTLQVVCGARATSDATDIIGQKASLEMKFHASDRTFKGRVTEVRDDSEVCVMTIESSIARLRDTHDYRTFVGSTAVDIVKVVLSEHGIDIDPHVARTLTPLEQCVQAWESDLDFCSRILAEEGITWFPKKDESDIVTLVDAAGQYEDSGISLDFVEHGGLAASEAVHAASLRQTIVHDMVSLRDYDFEHPQLDLNVAQKTGGLEWYEFPGGFTTTAVGKDLAALRLEQLQANGVVLEGEASAPKLQAGYSFSLDGAPNAAMNGKWTVVAVSHEATDRTTSDEQTYVAKFTAVPAKTGYRAARTEKPVFGGVETSTVTGPSGQELHLDQHGRTKTLLRWERRLAGDDKSSAWARVTQPQLSGAIFNPRVGWEELIGFVGVGADRPVVLGRLYNGAATPPAGLPGAKVQTHFGTMTTPNGSSGSSFTIDDTAGAEHMALVSAGKFEEQTENDKVLKVAADGIWQIAANRGLTVKETKVTNVDGAYSISIAGLRKVTTDSNYSVHAGSEKIAVGGARLFRVGGDYYTTCVDLFRLVGAAKAEAPIEHQSVFTQGASAFLVKGAVTTKAALAESVSVLGAAIVKVSGAKTVKSNGYGLDVKGLYFENFSSRSAEAGSDCNESFRSLTYTMTAGGKITGSSVAVEATSKLTIKAGGVTVEMTPSSITIDGDFDGSTASVEEGTHSYG